MPEQRVEDIIREEATKQGVPPALALAVAEQESGFNPTLFGPEITVGGKKVKAIGTFQLLPDTATMLKVDPMDPRQNIAGGVRYLRTLLDQHQGDTGKALSTYGGVVHNTDYVPGVLQRMQRFQSLEAATTAATASQTARTTAGGRSSGPGPAGRPMVGNLTDPTGRASGAGPGAPPSALGSGPPLPSFSIKGALEAFDPRNPEGRRNLAGAAGEVGLTALAGVPVVGPGASVGARILTTGARIAVPAIGAAAGGAAAQVGENLAGTGETTGMGGVTGSPTADAALLQGAYSVGGQAMLWPIRRAGRAFLGTRVGEAAAIKTAEAVAVARAEARAGIDAARDFATAAMRDLRGRTAASIAQVELENDVAIEGAKAVINSLAHPSVTATTTAMREVFEGPTKVALDKAGERVAAAAVTGPPVKLDLVQAALEQMVSKAKPAALFGAAADGTVAPVGVGQMANIAANTARTSAAGTMATPATRITAEQFKALMAQQLAQPSEARIPLNAVLDQVRALGDQELAFADAHALKRLLDERVTWDRAAKSINEQLTKGVRQALRQTLDVHPEYNAATAAYAQLVSLYRRGVGKKLATSFRASPDAAASILNPKQPGSAQALRSLLVDQAAAGGDAAAGQAAWDGARSVFTHSKLLAGGADGLTARIAKLRAESPEFFKTVYGDPAGQEIISNLVKIGSAVEQAQAQGAFRTAVVKEASEDAVIALEQSTKQATRDATRKGAEAVAASKARKAEFEKSSLVPPKTGAQVLGDVAHVGITGGRTGWAVRSLLRLLSAPTSADLLQWAAYSPARTQQMVRILTNPMPDRAAAGFLRAAVGALGEQESTETPAKPAASK
jgi:hypothetical protein